MRATAGVTNPLPTAIIHLKMSLKFSQSDPFESTKSYEWILYSIFYHAQTFKNIIEVILALATVLAHEVKKNLND